MILRKQNNNKRDPESSLVALLASSSLRQRKKRKEQTDLPFGDADSKGKDKRSACSLLHRHFYIVVNREEIKDLWTNSS